MSPPGAAGAAAARVAVNGNDIQVPAGASILDLLRQLSLPTDRVAVERNLVVVPRARHGGTPVEDGDRYEIVAFVGGG